MLKDFKTLIISIINFFSSSKEMAEENKQIYIRAKESDDDNMIFM